MTASSIVSPPAAKRISVAPSVRCDSDSDGDTTDEYSAASSNGHAHGASPAAIPAYTALVGALLGGIWYQGQLVYGTMIENEGRAASDIMAPVSLLLVFSLALGVAWEQLRFERSTRFVNMPVVRNHLFPYVGQGLPCLVKVPWDLFTSFHRQFGPVVAFQLLGATAVSVASPEFLKVILQSKVSSVKKDVVQSYNHFLVILGTGIVTAESTAWMSQRLKMSNALRRDVLDVIPRLTLLSVQRLMAQLDEAADKGDMQGVEISEAFRRLTLQVISRAFLSISADESDSTFAEVYIPIVDESNSRVFLPYRAWMFFAPSWWQHKHNVYRLNSYVSRIIRKRWEARRAANIVPQRRPSRTSFNFGTNDKDMLDYVLEAYELEQRELGVEPTLTSTALCQIRDEMKTFLLAGHETSAAMLTWCMYELIGNSQLCKEVAAEAGRVFSTDVDWKEAKDSALPSLEELSKLSLGEACLKETLRKYSVVPLVSRHATEDVYIDPKDTKHSYHIPKGSTVLVNIQAVHHNPDIWPSPMTFDPRSRFLNPDSPPKPYTFLPFIAGPRNCLGQHLSLLESKMVLGLLAQRYEFCLSDGAKPSTSDWSDSQQDPRHRRMVPICPKQSVHVVVTRRKAA